MTFKPESNWKLLVENQTERLKSPLSWFPFPAFISISLTIIFIGHLIISVNPRFGNIAEPINFKATPIKDGGIWISVSTSDKYIIVMTSKKDIFKIPINFKSWDAIAPLTNYFKSAVKETAVTAILSEKLRKNHSQVVISADQKLKYLHLNPVLVAIADAGISSYAFETQLSNRLETGSDKSSL